MVLFRSLKKCKGHNKQNLYTNKPLAYFSNKKYILCVKSEKNDTKIDILQFEKGYQEKGKTNYLL